MVRARACGHLCARLHDGVGILITRNEEGGRWSVEEAYNTASDEFAPTIVIGFAKTADDSRLTSSYLELRSQRHRADLSLTVTCGDCDRSKLRLTVFVGRLVYTAPGLNTFVALTPDIPSGRDLPICLSLDTTAKLIEDGGKREQCNVMSDMSTHPCQMILPLRINLQVSTREVHHVFYTDSEHNRIDHQ